MRRAASVHGGREENYSTKGCSARAQASLPLAQFTLAIANSTYRKGICTEREREREEDEAGALHSHTWTHRRGGRRPVARSGSSCRREEGARSAGSGPGRTARERIGSGQARAPTEARPPPRWASRSTPWSGLRRRLAAAQTGQYYNRRRRWEAAYGNGSMERWNGSLQLYLATGPARARLGLCLGRCSPAGMKLKQVVCQPVRIEARAQPRCDLSRSPGTAKMSFDGLCWVDPRLGQTEGLLHWCRTVLNSEQIQSFKFRIDNTFKIQNW
jgi:hypothetical protein